MVPDSNFLPLRNDLWSEPYHLRPFLVKLEQGSKDFTFWCEGVGIEGGGIAPTSFTGSRKPEGTFLFLQKSATDMRL